MYRDTYRDYGYKSQEDFEKALGREVFIECIPLYILAVLPAVLIIVCL